jgi:serine/threonine-protein kinase
LYHALTGELPFPEGTVLQRLLDHQDKPVADPALKNRRISPALSAVIRKMMAGDARKRYQSAEDLLRDLLIIAHALGLRGVAADGSLPVAWPRIPQGSLIQVVGWSLTLAAFVGAVAALSLRPDLLRVVRGEQPRLAVKPTPISKAFPADGGASTASVSDARASQPQPAAPLGDARDDRSPPPSTGSESLPPAGESLIAPLTRPGELPLDPETLFGDERLRLPASVVAPETSVSGPRLPRSKAQEAATSPAAAEVSPHPATAIERPPPIDPPAERLPPFLVVGSGKAFDSLDAACAEVRDQQATIELQFDGRLPTPQRPLRLINKRITLQAARGRRPVLWFAPKETIIDNNQSRMIYVAGGSLSVMNVDLELQIPNQLSNADLWALFCCARPDHLRLMGVTATVNNPAHHAAAVVELTAPVGDSMSKMGMMKDGMPFAATQIRVDRSLLRGECTGFRIRDAAAVRCDLEQSLFAVGEWLIQAELPVNAPPNPPRLTVSLDHTTCLLGNGLYSSQGGDDLSRRQLGVDFFPHDNIFATASNLPLIDQQLASDQMEIRQLVLWNGDRNFFDQMDQFWVVHMPATGSRGMNFEAWCSFWGPSESAGSRNDPIAWHQAWRLRRWSEITAADARLDRSVVGNPPLNASAGALDAGAALELLPGESDFRKAGRTNP